MTPASKRAAVMDTEGATSRKRARTSTTDAQSHAAAKALVASTLDDPANDTLPESDVVQLARYARYLEAQLSATCGTTSGKVQAKRGTAQAAKSAAHVAMSTAEAATGTAQAKTETVRISRRPLKQLVRAADSFKRSVADRISEQMNWTPSCKTDSAEWSYDCTCPHDVFMHLFNLEDPHTWTAKKLPKHQFLNIFGRIRSYSDRRRYETLYITGEDVNIHWSTGSSDGTGELKLSGTYGITGGTREIHTVELEGFGKVECEVYGCY